MDQAPGSTAQPANPKRTLPTGMSVDGGSHAKSSEKEYLIESRWFSNAQVVTPSPHNTPDATALQTDLVQLVQHLVPFVRSISEAVSEVVDYQSNTHTSASAEG